MSRRHTSSHRIACWRLTRTCNRACPFCLSRSGPAFSHPRRLVAETVSRLKDLGVEKVTYTGGEPLLSPDLGKAILECHQRGIGQVVTTNGDLVPLIDLQLLRLVDYVKLSFYGDEPAHDGLMGLGHYRFLGRAVTVLISAGVAVGANFMLSRRSRRSVAQFLEDAACWGIRQVLLMSYISVGNRRIDDRFQLTDVQRVASEIGEWIACHDPSYFPGGIKIHNYSAEAFTIVLDEKDTLTLASDRPPPCSLGGLFDEKLTLPNGESVAAREVLRRIWDVRRTTDAIMPLGPNAQ